MKARTAILLVIASVTAIAAQAASAAAPYVGLEQRSIKALSQDQIDDLRAGRGMGLALAAELNGFPGPKHVLELGDELALTPDQRQRTEVLFQEMQRQAVALGEQVIAGEEALDRLFLEGRPSEHQVEEATLALGLLQGKLRAHHLRYHLAMHELLSQDQVDRYRALRGYATPGTGHRGHPLGGHRP
jgi:Spy/CpxP family protein refolding chaperone